MFPMFWGQIPHSSCLNPDCDRDHDPFATHVTIVPCQSYRRLEVRSNFGYPTLYDPIWLNISIDWLVDSPVATDISLYFIL